MLLVSGAPVAPHLISAHTIVMAVLSVYAAETPHHPESISRLWSDPLSWPQWDEDVAEVRFDAPMALGATGWMRPTSGPSTTFTVAALVHNELVTTTSRLPGAVVRFEHVVTAIATGSTVRVTISVDGPLSPLWKRVLRKGFAGAAERNVTGVIECLDRA